VLGSEEDMIMRPHFSVCGSSMRREISKSPHNLEYTFSVSSSSSSSSLVAAVPLKIRRRRRRNTKRNDRINHP